MQACKRLDPEQDYDVRSLLDPRLAELRQDLRYIVLLAMLDTTVHMDALCKYDAPCASMLCLPIHGFACLSMALHSFGLTMIGRSMKLYDRSELVVSLHKQLQAAGLSKGRPTGLTGTCPIPSADIAVC